MPTLFHSPTLGKKGRGLGTLAINLNTIAPYRGEERRGRGE